MFFEYYVIHYSSHVLSILLICVQLINILVHFEKRQILYFEKQISKERKNLEDWTKLYPLKNERDK